MAQHTFRVPKLDLQTILTEQHPHIDLRLASYETSTRNFLKAVSGYTQRALSEITRRKNVHIAEKNRIAERTQQIENETNNCKVKELELIATLEKEREEKKEAELSVAHFERQLASVKEQGALLDVEIEQRQAVVTNMQRERDREHHILNAYASRTSPELEEFQRHLKCVIEGIDADQILIRFTHIDPSDHSREFSLVLNVSESLYKVPTASPLPPTLPLLLEELNETRDVYSFIKQVRQAFEQLATQGR